MALAPSLLPGFRYRIAQGLLMDEIVTIVDNKTFPDGTPGKARKVTVKFDDGSIDYVLPRLIDETPVGIENPALVPVVAPTAPVVVVDPVNEASPDLIEAVTPLLDTTSTQPITDPMDPRLDHLRPSRSKLRKYVSRSMSNGMSDIDFALTFASDDFRASNEARPLSIMFKGDTQGGKTMFVEVLAIAWADKLGLPKPMPIFTLSGSSGVTDYDLFGQTTSFTNPETGEESLVWLPGIVDLAAQCGGILYLDEVNAMGERVTSSLHPLVDHRHQFINRNKPVLRNGVFMPETVTAHEDLWIIGTYNEGYQGMGRMNEAFKNRFQHIRWDYNEAVENKLITSPTIRLLGGALRQARAARNKGLRTPVGTAALMRLEQSVQAFGVDLALETFTGLFEAGEVDVVEAIIRDRSIIILLGEEEAQRQAEAQRDIPASDDPLTDLRNMTGSL